MENILKSDGEGVVKRVTIEKEQVVDKGQLLIEFEQRYFTAIDMLCSFPCENDA